MIDDLTVEAIDALPRIFKLDVDRVPGSQTLSVERLPGGLLAEIATVLAGDMYRVLTATRDNGDFHQHAGGTGSRVSVSIGGVSEDSLSWERESSDTPWRIMIEPEAGLYISVITTADRPVAEIQLVETTVWNELPAAFRP